MYPSMLLYPRNLYLAHSCSRSSSTIWSCGCLCECAIPVRWMLFAPIRTSDISTVAASLHSKMKVWADEWKVTFKPTKCKTMVLSRKRTPSKLILYFGYCMLSTVDELDIIVCPEEGRKAIHPSSGHTKYNLLSQQKVVSNKMAPWKK